MAQFDWERLSRTPFAHNIATPPNRKPSHTDREVDFRLAGYGGATAVVA